jgi:serine/threonine protein phosphatase PrpC
LALAAGGRDNISVVVVDVVARNTVGEGWVRP